MITGGMKFFEKSKCLYKDGNVASASTNTESAKYILDMNKYTEWKSLGSDDSIEESVVIDLESEETFNRLFVTEFNFKSFEIQYWNGTTWTSFTNVVGVNGTTYTGINVTDYTFDSAYFEFDSVSATRIRITCLTTQTPNSEKTICNFIITSEIGTFKGFPRVDPKSMMNEVKTKTLGGKYLINKGAETVQIKVNFKTHPYQNDVDIMEELWSRTEPFLVYACGGRTGQQYFKISQKIWELKDVFNMQTAGDLDSDFEKGVYILGVNKNITFEESI